jgi:phosphoribosylamine---glycine ligase
MATRVLLIGQDGRTDCLAEALLASGAELHTVCNLPNHPGLAAKSKTVRWGRADDVPMVVDFAREVRPDLVVVGPEDPLAAGVVDGIQAALGTPCFGPTRALAQLEASKTFTRDLLARHRIPGSLRYRAFTSLDGVEAYMHELGQFVVKADGLMGGKGVKVFGEHLTTIAESVEYAKSLLPRGQVVVEEKVEGEEFSLQSICDGEHTVATIPVQDHKRAFEDDRGPNTGGMGSYSAADHLLPFLSPEEIAEAARINALVGQALREQLGAPYRGVLYGGFMATRDGVRVLEYNARFGDPETVNVVPLIEGDVLEILMAAATGTLAKTPVTFRRRATVCKYVVPEGYPDAPVKNERIDLRDLPPAGDHLRVYAAALRQDDGHVVMTGSRALAVVGIAETIPVAADIAEEAIGRVRGRTMHRRDIGSPALLQRRVDHLAALRRAT